MPPKPAPRRAPTKRKRPMSRNQSQSRDLRRDSTKQNDLNKLNDQTKQVDQSTLPNELYKPTSSYQTPNSNTTSVNMDSRTNRQIFTELLNLEPATIGSEQGREIRKQLMQKRNGTKYRPILFHETNRDHWNSRNEIRSEERAKTVTVGEKLLTRSSGNRQKMFFENFGDDGADRFQNRKLVDTNTHLSNSEGNLANIRNSLDMHGTPENSPISNNFSRFLPSNRADIPIKLTPNILVPKNNKTTYNNAKTPKISTIGYTVMETLKVPIPAGAALPNNGDLKNTTMISTKSKTSIKKDLKNLGKGVVKTVETTTKVLNTGMRRRKVSKTDLQNENLKTNTNNLTNMNKSITRKKERLGLHADSERNHLRIIQNDRKMPLTYASTVSQNVLHGESGFNISNTLITYYHNMLEQSMFKIFLVLFFAYCASMLFFANLYFWMECFSRIFMDCSCLNGLTVQPSECQENSDFCTIEPSNHSSADWNDMETSFGRSFLLALESQTTIGYGARYPKDQCIWPQIVQSAQYILNLILMGHIILIVTQRMIKRRILSLIRFSSNAVICERYCLVNGPGPNIDIGNGLKGEKRLCLMIRVAPRENMPSIFSMLTSDNNFLTEAKKYELVGVSITAKVLVTRTTIEHEFLPLEEREVTFENADHLFGWGPIDYYHCIDEFSPFYEVSSAMLLNPNINLEFVVIITATIESTGTTYQCKRSYINTDIKFGQKFDQCIFREKNEYMVNYDKFDEVSKCPDFDLRSMENRRENNEEETIIDNLTESDVEINVRITSDCDHGEMSTPRKLHKNADQIFDIKSENSGLEDSLENVPLKSVPSSGLTGNGSRRSRFTIEKVND